MSDDRLFKKTPKPKLVELLSESSIPYECEPSLKQNLQGSSPAVTSPPSSTHLLSICCCTYYKPQLFPDMEQALTNGILECAMHILFSWPVQAGHLKSTLQGLFPFQVEQPLEYAAHADRLLRHGRRIVGSAAIQKLRIRGLVGQHRVVNVLPNSNNHGGKPYV